jgi:hypothetical protein
MKMNNSLIFDKHHTDLEIKIKSLAFIALLAFVVYKIQNNK